MRSLCKTGWMDGLIDGFMDGWERQRARASACTPRASAAAVCVLARTRLRSITRAPCSPGQP
eukprot:361477-Chlamydomonas_euryale.AAC.1